MKDIIEHVMKFETPAAKDELGRWMEKHGAQIGFHCAFGKYTVDVSWRKVHSYSDVEGSHTETWELSRTGADLHDTMHAAIEAATKKTSTPDATMSPIPDYGDHMTMAEFAECVAAGGFTNDDGDGHYATATEMSDVRVHLRDLDRSWTHVVWFNK